MSRVISEKDLDKKIKNMMNNQKKEFIKTLNAMDKNLSKLPYL